MMDIQRITSFFCDAGFVPVPVQGLELLNSLGLDAGIYICRKVAFKAESVLCGIVTELQR